MQGGKLREGVLVCVCVRVQRNPGGAGPAPRSRSPDWLLVRLSSLSADGAGMDALNPLPVRVSVMFWN